MREQETEFTVERTAATEGGASDARPSAASARCGLVGSMVTLNGRPAVVIGATSDFATIAALDGSARFEWPWPRVVEIVRAGGNFES